MQFLFFEVFPKFYNAPCPIGNSLEVEYQCTFTSVNFHFLVLWSIHYLESGCTYQIHYSYINLLSLNGSSQILKKEKTILYRIQMMYHMSNEEHLSTRLTLIIKLDSTNQLHNNTRILQFHRNVAQLLLCSITCCFIPLWSSPNIDIA